MGKQHRILYICTHNSARSQMAEAFTREYGGDSVLVESAGLEPSELNPLVVEVMRESGFDITKHTVDSVFDFYKQGRIYDYVITVCDADKEASCPVFAGVQRRLSWRFEDPSAIASSQEGTTEQKLQKVRDIRDQVEKQVKAFVESLQEG